MSIILRGKLFGNINATTPVLDIEVHWYQPEKGHYWRFSCKRCRKSFLQMTESPECDSCKSTINCRM